MLSLGLIALVIGVSLLILIKNQTKVKERWMIFVAWFVIVMAAISIIFSAYHTIKYRVLGKNKMHHRMMMNQKMRDHFDENRYDTNRERQRPEMSQY